MSFNCFRLSSVDSLVNRHISNENGDYSPTAKSFAEQNTALTEAAINGRINLIKIFNSEYTSVDKLSSPRGHAYAQKQSKQRKSNSPMSEGAKLKHLQESSTPFSIYCYGFEKQHTLMPAGRKSLAKHIQESVPTKKFEVFCRVARQISAYIKALKEKRLIHGDIKPNNIFFMDDQSTQLRIGDVEGLEQIDAVNNVLITANYAAPELLFKTSEKKKFASDIWSFACVLYEMITRTSLFRSFYTTLARLKQLEVIFGELPEDFKKKISKSCFIEEDRGKGLKTLESRISKIEGRCSDIDGKFEALLKRNKRILRYKEDKRIFQEEIKKYRHDIKKMKLIGNDSSGFKDWKEKIRSQLQCNVSKWKGDFIDLLSRMLDLDPEKRATIEEVDAFFMRGQKLIKINIDEEVLRKREDFTLKFSYPTFVNPVRELFINGTVPYHHAHLPIVPKERLDVSLLRGGREITMLKQVAIKSLENLHIRISEGTYFLRVSYSLCDTGMHFR